MPVLSGLGLVHESWPLHFGWLLARGLTEYVQLLRALLLSAVRGLIADVYRLQWLFAGRLANLTWR